MKPAIARLPAKAVREKNKALVRDWLHSEGQDPERELWCDEILEGANHIGVSLFHMMVALIELNANCGEYCGESLTDPQFECIERLADDVNPPPPPNPKVERLKAYLLSRSDDVSRGEIAGLASSFDLDRLVVMTIAARLSKLSPSPEVEIDQLKTSKKPRESIFKDIDPAKAVAMAFILFVSFFVVTCMGAINAGRHDDLAEVRASILRALED